MTAASLRALRRDARGATIVEFAIVAPVMLLLILGLSELTYQAYVHAILSGAMQKAGRDSTIGGNENAASGIALDEQVMSTVRRVSAHAQYVSSRKSYAQFGHVAPEPFQDNNSNNSYDLLSECFTDLNANNIWDSDPGRSGQGGASDVVVYKMNVTYNRLFPLASLWAERNTETVSVTTILRNQPYKGQSVPTPTQVCPT
jgi:Flp pilus assembly pilin Flp